MTEDDKMRIEFQHLQDINEDYVTHFKAAIKYSGIFFIASITSLIHALLPNIFADRVPKIIKKINHDINLRQMKSKPWVKK